MRRLEARITWVAGENGWAPFSGMQPSFLAGVDLIMSKVTSKNHAPPMEWGQTCDVTIELPYGEHYDEHLMNGMPVRLQIGGRIIAEGNVTG